MSALEMLSKTILRYRTLREAVAKRAAEIHALEAAAPLPTTGSGSGVRQPPPLKYEPRCPHCGTWLSTRYGGHDASTCHVTPPRLLAPGYDPAKHTTMCRLRYRHSLGCTCETAASPAHALNRAGSYQATPTGPGAPASPVTAAVWGWLAGAISGALVAVLAMSLR